MRTRIRRRSDSLRLSLNLSASDFRVNDFERLRPRLRKFVILLVTPHRHTCARTRRHEKARATPHRLVRAWSWLLLLPAKPCTAVQIRSSPSLFAIPICGSEQVLTRIDRVVADPVRYARDRSIRGHTGHGLVTPWSRGVLETTFRVGRRGATAACPIGVAASPIRSRRVAAPCDDPSIVCVTSS